ncbi:MAG: preprotein translocase subunit YajC [Coriobacteriia bacterium]|nr:preprotein translocase subunit YajC [Coriobacteriia bacterium]
MDSAALAQVLWIALVLGGMYLLFIRPQMKRQKEQQALMASLEVGDRIVTMGGIFGTVVSLEDDRVGLEIAPALVIEVLRSAVARKLEG